MVKQKQKGEKFTRRDIFVSAVVVLRSPAESGNSYLEELSSILRKNYANYEIIIVDNGMRDDEIKLLSGQLLKIPCVRVIRLAQTLKYDSALFAGLEVSIGDYVCTLDPSIDPLSEISNLIKKNYSNDVVQGISTEPISASAVGQASRRLFYWYSRRYIGINVPVNATYFSSYSRRAVNSLTQSTRSQRHIRHLARRVGYSYATFSYKPLGLPGESKKFKNGLIEALEIAISYSTHPLRFVTWLGLLAAVINAGYTGYILLLNVFRNNIAEGWTTTSLQLSVMFFLLFIAIVIISEYIGRILTESYKDPHYYISDELTSTVALVDADRRNVVR